MSSHERGAVKQVPICLAMISFLFSCFFPHIFPVVAFISGSETDICDIKLLLAPFAKLASGLLWNPCALLWNPCAKGEAGKRTGLELLFAGRSEKPGGEELLLETLISGNGREEAGKGVILMLSCMLVSTHLRAGFCGRQLFPLKAAVFVIYALFPSSKCFSLNPILSEAVALLSLDLMHREHFEKEQTLRCFAIVRRLPFGLVSLWMYVMRENLKVLLAKISNLVVSNPSKLALSLGISVAEGRYVC